MIPDPTNPKIAIDPETGKLVGALMIFPPGSSIADIAAPTVAELTQGIPIGWLTDNVTRKHDDTQPPS